MSLIRPTVHVGPQQEAKLLQFSLSGARTFFKDGSTA